jgi:hypothetical protein
MKTLRLRFYPLKQDRKDSDSIIINFDEYLIKDVYFSSSKSDEDIVRHLEMLESMHVIWIDSWDIYQGSPQEG